MNVKERLKEFIKLEKMSVSDFEKSINTANGYVNSISKSIGVDKISTILENYPNINIEWLLTGNGEMLKTDNGTAYNVHNFESAAAAGSPQIINSEERNGLQPNMYLPDMSKNKFNIRVPVKGDSMHSTIKDGDRVVATMIENINDLRSGHIYVIVDADWSVVVKRVYREDNIIELVSDNEIYPPYKRGLGEILQFFHVEEVHTTDLRNYYDDVRRKVRDIETELQKVEREIQSLKK